ncbi:MAG TPA: 23S rRNA (guanosine(2251)-2'-O)-methyltransferase RlmB [Pyrinomonadaceae bacterium]|nr:23S rRNA (guanosine(2251)-2'-O)-methyltransferase RlmB [Pyrinomonadaceae bacterium]
MKGRNRVGQTRERREHRDNREPRREERGPRKPSVTASLYGVLPVLEALRAGGRRIEKIVVADGARQHRLNDIFELAREHRVIIETVPKERLERLVEPGANHQGVIAIAAAADYVDVDEIIDSANDPPLFVILDGVEDPRNLGAILRTVECAGADGVFIPERRAVGLTDTVAKSSAGAIEHVSVAKVTNLNRFIEDLKAKNVWVVGTSGDATMSYTEWDWTTPTALVLGAEGSGLHRLVAENCDALVKIPMYGKIDSLNVSVAAGVILFEARRQRDHKQE